MVFSVDNSNYFDFKIKFSVFSVVLVLRIPLINTIGLKGKINLIHDIPGISKVKRATRNIVTPRL